MTDRRFQPDLIAPCGMNCALCKAYLAYTHSVPRQRGKVTWCSGCRPRAKNCFVKRKCSKLTHNQLQYCSECDRMPCESVDRIDRRYRQRYGMSMVENLNMIRAKGMNEFLKSQKESHSCPNCGDVVSVHDSKCYSCGYRPTSIDRERPRGFNFLSFFWFWLIF